MDELSSLKRRIESLGRHGRRTAMLAGVLATLLAVIVLASAARRTPQVLRARGLVI